MAASGKSAWPNANQGDWTLSQHGAISPRLLSLGMPHFALAVANVKAVPVNRLGAATLAITRVSPRQIRVGPY
jgi:hypothetical protein